MRELISAMSEKYDPRTGQVQYKYVHRKELVAKSDIVKPRIPSLLTLDNEKISTVGDVSLVEELFRGIKELDLSKNLITDWKVVITLLEHMENLEFMNLTMNQLDDSTLDDDSMCKHPLKTLVLNGTGVSWPTIAKLVQCLPYLEELHISLNAYKSVDLPPGFRHCGKKLCKLYMNNNEISDWGEISKIAQAFPFIQSLNLITSKLSSLPETIPRDEFRRLMLLNLSQSKLQSWEEIDKLGRFVVLDNLRITEVPFLDQFEAKERRQHLISRLPRLNMLNGSPVTDSERDTAERAFIRHYMNQEEKPSIYHALEEKHGTLDKLADVDFSAHDPESNDSITLLVKFDDKMEYFDIDRNQTIAEFKKLLQNFTGLPSAETIVYFIELSDGVVQHVNHLRTASRKLFSYKMSKGDQFVLERRPPPTK